MPAPFNSSWQDSGAVTADKLDRTTHGSGTTSERNAITSWPTTRLFFDITLGELFSNGGTTNNIIWQKLNSSFLFGDGTDNTTLSANTSFNSDKYFDSLNIISGVTLTSTVETLRLFVRDTLRINGIINLTALGGAGGASRTSGSYVAGTAGIPKSIPQHIILNIAATLSGGGGGGGRGLSFSNNIFSVGGVGGRGAGGLLIVAKKVIIGSSGTIRARGEDGGAATILDSSTNIGPTGGGGGSGGIVVIYCQSIENDGTIDLAGGAGGSGATTTSGSVGAAGLPGTTGTLKVITL